MTCQCLGFGISIILLYLYLSVSSIEDVVATSATTTTTTTTMSSGVLQTVVVASTSREYSNQRRTLLSQKHSSINHILQFSGGGNIGDTSLLDDTTVTTVATTTPLADTDTRSSSSSSSSSSNTFSQEQCDDRSAYVKDILHRRHLHVQSGQRLRDIQTYMKLHGSDNPTQAIIASLRPTDTGSSSSRPYHPQQQSTDTNHIDPSSDDDTTVVSSMITSVAIATPSTDKSKVMKRYRRRDPFPIDRRNLNFDDTDNAIVPSAQKQPQQRHVGGTPMNCFIDATGEMSLDIRPPSMWQLGIRMTQLLMNFAPVWSTMGIAIVSSKFRQHYWYKWMTSSIGISGAAWIKWGQWSATRNDMFPDALCDELATLHASAPAHSWSYTALTLEQSLGLGTGTLHCVFDDIDIHPIASGSIAQVHKAILCGQPVALKIRHPNVRQLMEMDFRLMTIGAMIMDKIPALSWLHIRESVEQFSYTIAAQAHLQVEGHHLEVLNYNFRNWPRVSFPKPLFASPSTIIETFEPGKITTDIIDKYNDIADLINNNHVGDVASSGRKGVTVVEVLDTDAEILNGNETTADSNNATLLAGHDLMPVKLAKFLVSTGVSLYLKMLLIDNMMHADLHPGNIMVETKYKWRYPRRSANAETRLALNPDQQRLKFHNDDVLKAMDDKSIDEVRITLVDAGMVVKLTDEESSAFIGLLSSLGEGNGDEAAEYTLKFSMERNSMTVAQVRYFAADMVLLFQERCRGYGTNVDVGFVLRGILSLIRKHRVRIDANFATLVINCLCIESLARRVCPTYNVLDAGRPLLQGYRRFVDQQSTGRPHSSLWFSFRMTLNAFKKNMNDRLFFRQQAKQKYTVKQSVIKLIQHEI